ncbi:MAG TPA: Hexulose-6-phosphate synthase [Thermoprotei archaeon]|nr:Hexulose-6-phosphate synthase [Thermoprotei archaeon]
MGRLLKMVEELRKPLLQLALDFVRVEDALNILRKLQGLEIPVVEVGTPLIKSEGMKAVSIIRSVVPEETIVLADTKTADVGTLEVGIVSDAGGDVATVLASADDEVIKSALEEGARRDIDVVIDTVGVRDLPSRISELVGFGGRIINIHAGIDVQVLRGVTARTFVETVKKLKTIYPETYFSISGGIKPRDIEDILSSGASVVVVGSAITRADNPRDVVLQFLRGFGYGV